MQTSSVIAKIGILFEIGRGFGKILRKEYFKIGQNTKVKYREYLKNFFKFPNQEQINAYKNLQNGKVLIIDDISTTYSTITFLLKTVRAINKNCEIVVFCLVGNKE